MRSAVPKHQLQAELGFLLIEIFFYLINKYDLELDCRLYYDLIL